MKNLKFPRILIINLVLCFLIHVFTACQKDEVHGALKSTDLQATEKSIDRQITINDTESKTEARLIISAENAEMLEMVAENIEIVPVFESRIVKKQDEKGEKAAGSLAKGPYSGKVAVEILDTELPDQALGFKVKLRGMAHLEKMGTWLYTIAAPNWRQSMVGIYDGEIITWNDYSTCENYNEYTLNSPETILQANSTLTFPLAPQNVGYNRVSVEYEPGVDFYEIYFEIRGDCNALEACGSIETNEEQPVCCGLVSESPMSVKTMQQLSAFSRDELRQATLEATTLILKHQKVLDELVNTDPEVYQSIDRFFEQNSALFTNGFSNDHTIVREKHIGPAVDLIQLLERKVRDKELKTYLQELRMTVQNMNGKELKTALRTLEK